MGEDRIEMRQWERDRLKVMSVVLKGERTQAEAGRLLKLSVRQIRRIQDRLEEQGDQGVVHGLRGRASNARIEEGHRRRVLERYRARYVGFGPTLAAEKLGEDELPVAVRTLREWLVGEGLWRRVRQLEVHRERRLRRSCFGEMVQADASVHAWLEGRGAALTLVGMIDDATGRILCRFFESETTEAYMEVLGRWIERHGRPLSWYSDRHGIFRAESRLLGEDEPVSVPTQFSRALEELGMELILANSPQAKGRIERLWGTAQDRLVKELRLAGARSLEEANEVLESKFEPWFNGRCTVRPGSGNDAHRAVHGSMELSAILSIQEKRTVGNDYTIRLGKRVYQLYKPVWPGERGGKVVVEKRLDGSMRIRFKGRYLSYGVIGQKKEEEQEKLGAPPPNPRSLAPEPIPAGKGRRGKSKDRAGEPARPAVHRPAGCSGRTPALPCPSGGGSCGSSKGAWRPGAKHTWRKAIIRRSPRQADISIGRK